MILMGNFIIILDDSNKISYILIKKIERVIVKERERERESCEERGLGEQSHFSTERVNKFPQKKI